MDKDTASGKGGRDAWNGGEMSLLCLGLDFLLIEFKKLGKSQIPHNIIFVDWWYQEGFFGNHADEPKKWVLEFLNLWR